MGGVFLSYASDDWMVAARVHRDLQRAGLEAWGYQENGVLGVDFVAEYTEHIQRCSVFLLLDSPSARDSSYVRHEVRLAHERRNRDAGAPRLLVGLVHPPGPWQAAELFPDQVRHRWADLTNYEPGIRLICKELGVPYVPAFDLPEDQEFEEELRATGLERDRWERLLADYQTFRRRYQPSNLDAARRRLETLIDDCKDWNIRVVTPYLALGALLGDLHQDESAAAAFRRAAEIAPDDPRGWAGLGGCNYYLGDYRKAAENYAECRRRIAASTLPGHRARAPLVARNLAAVLEVLGRVREALEVLQSVETELGNDVLGLTLLGHLLLVNGEPWAARAPLRRALALAREEVAPDPGPWIDLADCYAQLGSPEEELDVLRQTVAAFPAESAVHRRLGAYYAGWGELDQAERHLRKAVACEGSRPRLRTRAELALVLLSQGLRAASRAEAEACLSIIPQTEEDEYYLGLAYHLLGECREAGRRRQKSRDDARIAAWREYADLVS